MSWKRTLLLFFASVVVLSAATWFVLRKTGVAKAFVQRMLAERINGPFALDDADVDLGRGTVTLKRFAIAHPTEKDRPLLQARDVRVSMNTNPLGEVGRVDKVVLRGVRIDDLQVSGPHALRLGDILKPGTESDGQKAYPAVVIEDAEVGVRFADDEPPLRFEDVDLELLPAEPGSAEMVLSGAMTTLLGTRVSVSGQGDIGKQRFRVLAKAESMPLSPAAVQPFSSDIADALAAAELAGHVALAQLWIETDEDGGALRGGFQADVDKLSFTAPEFPRRVEGSATVRGLLQDEGSVTLQFRGADERGRIELQGSVQRLFTDPMAHLEVDLAALRIDDELLRALAVQPNAARVVAAFAPATAGELDADVRLDLRGDSYTVAVDAALRGMSATFLGFPGAHRVAFPYPLHNVAGTVRVRDEVLELDAVQAEDAHGGKVEVAGHVPLAEQSPPGNMVIRGADIQFSPELRAALAAIAPESVRHYEACAPEGRTDVEVRVDNIGDLNATDFAVHIAPQDAVVTHALFPYRCEQVTGRVDIDADGVVFDLTGRRSGKAVAARGRFVRPPPTVEDAELASEFWARAEDLTIDDDLRRALTSLAPTTENLWTTLSPQGRVACELSSWRAAGDQSNHYDIRVDVLAGQICPSALPLPVTDLHGPVFVHGDGDAARVEVHLVEGKLEQGAATEAATVFLTGDVRHGASGHDIDLTSIARGVALRPELRDVLDRAGALPAAAWDALHPTGKVDVIARHRATPEDPAPRNHLRLMLNDVGVQASWLPAPATRLSGEILATEGHATASELRGLVGTTPVVLRNGEVWHEGTATRIRATLNADDFPLDDDVARLFGDSPLRRAYLDRRVRGRANITTLDLDSTVPDAADGGFAGFRLTASGQMTLRDCSLEVAVPIDHVDGILTVRECVVAPEGGHVAGSLANLSMQILDRTVHDFSATLDATADEITLGDLSLRLHGGRIVGQPGAPHLRYQTAGEGTLSANLSWQGVRLSELGGTGGRNSGGVTGNLAGSLQLEALPGTRIIDAKAQGEVHITGGRLGDVPLFRTIYAVLRRQPQFHSADTTFRVADRTITIDTMTLGSQILNVRGKGTVSMDGYVDMTIELPDLFGDAADFLILPEILHNAVAQVLQFKLHGYLRNPEVTPLTPFQGAPARREIGPIPAPLADLPRRRF
ncbi:MAG: AsmA-like C-terminal region-containing protein [Planctomycetota bacterium]